jgi:hypothetical protein
LLGNNGPGPADGVTVKDPQRRDFPKRRSVALQPWAAELAADNWQALRDGSGDSVAAINTTVFTVTDPGHSALEEQLPTPLIYAPVTLTDNNPSNNSASDVAMLSKGPLNNGKTNGTNTVLAGGTTAYHRQ